MLPSIHGVILTAAPLKKILAFLVLYELCTVHMVLCNSATIFSRGGLRRLT